MLHIDQHIFDEISRYEEGELEGSERVALEHKLQTDPKYQQHWAYYHTVTKAIARTVIPRQGENINPEEETTSEKTRFYDDILAHDQRATRRRVNGFRALVMLMVAAGGFWMGRLTLSVPFEQQRPIEKPTQPVAGMGEEGEELLGSAGRTEMQKLADSVEWIRRTHDGSTKQYLKIGNTLFMLPLNASEPPPTPAQDTSILRLIMKH